MEGGLKVLVQTPREQPAQSSYLQMREGSGGKFDVHCFLFTDMLLVCKTTTKKAESRTARVRVLRPPYLVERLVVQELAREPPTLACVYLNEYKVATAAFLLTSPEPKLVKTWADMIRKAQGLYAQVSSEPAANANALGGRSLSKFYSSF